MKRLGQEPKRQALYRMSSVDITHSHAIGVETVKVVLSEYGPDLSRFPTEKQFVSHVTLAPRVPKSGDKPLKKSPTVLARVLRLPCAWRHCLRHSQTALGAHYSRIAQRLGGDIAVFATARKLATLIYRLLRWGQPYIDEGAEAYEIATSKNLSAKARQLGYQLTPASA